MAGRILVAIWLLLFAASPLRLEAAVIETSVADLDFGEVAIGSTTVREIVVANPATDPVLIKRLWLLGDFGDGSIGPITPFVLSPGASLSLAIAFTPRLEGEYQGGIYIEYFGGGVFTLPITVGLRGTAVWPQLHSSRTSIEFPRQAVDTTGAAETVLFTNTGRFPVILTAIVASGDFGYRGCGAGTSIAPGAACALEVSFSPRTLGALDGSLLVASNASGAPHIVALSGVGVPRWGASISLRPSAVDFGEVAFGSRAVERIHVFSNGMAALAIAGISVSGPEFSHQSDCPAALPVGAECAVDVTYAPPALGHHRGLLTIASDGDPPTIELPLLGQGVANAPPRLITEARIDFGEHVVGSSWRYLLPLRNLGGQALDIREFRVKGLGFRVEGSCPVLEPGAHCEVGVVFEPRSVASFRGSLEFLSGGAQGGVTTELLGQGVAAPRAALALSVEGIGFADQIVATQSPSQPVTLRNSGAQALHIEGISTSGPFVVTQNACEGTLGPGAGCEVRVAFRPAARGLAEGRLTIASDASPGRDFVSLSGTGCQYARIMGRANRRAHCSP